MIGILHEVSKSFIGNNQDELMKGTGAKNKTKSTTKEATRKVKRMWRCKRANRKF